MIALGIVATLAAWATFWAIGEAVARVLYGRRYALVARTIRLPLGIAFATCVLEGAGYFLPIGVAAWLLLPPAACGVALWARNLRRAKHWEPSVLATSAIALAVGLVPVAIAGRFTASALTNNDGTYYVTAADRLLTTPWATTYEVRDGDIPVAQCLIERVLHWWNWRTGTPNLMAALSALTGLSSLQALPAITAVLFASVPGVTLAIARGLGVPPKRRHELLMGALATCSAAPAFVAFQHMTGQLAACSLFPLGAATLLGAARLGGLRRYFTAAIVLAAGIALFADGSATLALTVVVVLVANTKTFARALGRLTLVGVATGAIAPFTVYRALRAGVGTVGRAKRPQQVLFPQRGWLPRGVLDDLATVKGVDPWPPWPGTWPPNAQTLIAWIGGISGAALFVYGFERLRPQLGERRMAALLALVVPLSVGLLHVRYLSGKVLLMAAAFAVPVAAVGAVAVLHRRARWLVVPLALGELAALGELSRPARWKAVDRPDTDALVPELARVPAGSLVALDGFGAPADDVLDAHRAHRAALLAGLNPIQPGLDGGFYRPRCDTATRPDPLPAAAYALQRDSSENLTRGKELSRWGAFRLVEVDLTKPDAFVAVWAPTHGWMKAERESSGRVFRWAEARAKGTLQVVGPAPCVRLTGELRLVDGTAWAEVRIGDDVVFSGEISAVWSKFSTRPIHAMAPTEVAFMVPQVSVAPPDAAHTLALRGLSVEAVSQCLTVSRSDASGAPVRYPIDFTSDVELTVDPAAGAPCSTLTARVAGEAGATVRVSVDGGPPIVNYMLGSVGTIALPFSGEARPRRLRLAHGGKSAEWKLEGMDVAPRACAD